MPFDDKEERDDILKLGEEISNFFEDLMYSWGGSPLLGRIYALCILTLPEEAIFQKDLAEKFNVNPATISRNLKELENWKLINRRREPGTREWQYQIEDTSYLELMLHKFEENAVNLQEKLDDLKRVHIKWGTSLSDESKQEKTGKHALKALEHLIKWMETVEEELDEFIKKLQRKYVELETSFERE